MLTSIEIKRLPRKDRSVNRASHAYYQALLSGVPDEELQRLRRAWVHEILKRWPDTVEQRKNS